MSFAGSNFVTFVKETYGHPRVRGLLISFGATKFALLRDGPIENLWEVGVGGGGGGRSTKKIFEQGKIKWKKILARQLILKNIHAMA